MVMVSSHPCAMRSGPRLRERITVVPVLPAPEVPFDRWPTANYRQMPLPNLTAPGTHYAAMLEEPTTVSSALLDPRARLALLTERGIMLFQQRKVHNDTRVAIEPSTLHEACAAVLAEVEMHESWNLALVSPQVDEGADLAATLDTEAASFDVVMSGVQEDGVTTLRDLLRDPASRASVRRDIGQAIAARRI
jgi:hypothetical protein